MKLKNFYLAGFTLSTFAYAILLLNYGGDSEIFLPMIMASLVSAIGVICSNGYDLCVRKEDD